MTESKFDTLDALIKLSVYKLVEKDVEYLNSINEDEHKLRPAFERRMRKKIKRLCSPKEYNPRWVVPRRTAIACLIAVSIMFGVIISIEAVRHEIWIAIVEWFDKYLSVSFEPDKEAPEYIIEKREPQYLPDGCEKEVLSDTVLKYNICYLKDGVDILNYKQLPLNDKNSYHDIENMVITEIKINGYDALLMNYKEKSDEYVITWNDNEYIYYISNNGTIVDENTLIKIAESVK